MKLTKEFLLKETKNRKANITDKIIDLPMVSSINKKQFVVKIKANFTLEYVDNSFDYEYGSQKGTQHEGDFELPELNIELANPNELQSILKNGGYQSEEQFNEELDITAERYILNNVEKFTPEPELNQEIDY